VDPLRLPWAQVISATEGDGVNRQTAAEAELLVMSTRDIYSQAEQRSVPALVLAGAATSAHASTVAQAHSGSRVRTVGLDGDPAKGLPNGR